MVELVFSLAAILGAAVFFTNAVEMLGERLNLGSGAVGSILAAVGTALPETMIPVVALVGAYAVYVWWTIMGGGESVGEAPDDLTLWPESSWGQAPTWAVAGQLLASLAVLVGGAPLFLEAVEHLSSAVGVPAGLISLVLAPLATELPEKFNSVIWLRDDKDTLAFGNINGAMVFQSTLPVSLGLLFTRWELGFLNVFSVILTLVAGAGLFVLLLRKGPIKAWYLLGGGVLYLVFLAAVVYDFVL